MSHLNEARIEDEHIGWVPGDVLRSALPLDRALRKIRFASLVHIKPKFFKISGERTTRS